MSTIASTPSASLLAPDARLAARARGGDTRALAHEAAKTLVTEQVYVHSKVVIVDDRVAVVGSAILARQSWLVDAHVQAQVPADRATEVAALLHEAAQASPEALKTVDADVELRTAARRITSQSVALGWGISTAALGVGLATAWRGLRHGPARTL